MKRRLSHPMRIITLAILLIGLSSAPQIYSQIKQRQLQQQLQKDQALIAAIKARDNQKTLQLLLVEGANGETRDPEGEHLPALLLLYKLAVETSRHNETPDPGPDLTVVRTLLDQGAKVDDRNAQGESVLYYAAQFSNANTITLLLTRGADIETKDNNGVTPLMVATAETTSVLLDHGADIEACDNQQDSPLKHAVRNDRLEVVDILLEHGATCSMWGDFSDVQAAVWSHSPNAHKIEALLRAKGPANGDPDTARFKSLKRSGAISWIFSVRHQVFGVYFTSDGKHIIYSPAPYGPPVECSATTGDVESEDAYGLGERTFGWAVSPDVPRVLSMTGRDGHMLLQVFDLKNSRLLFTLPDAGDRAVYSRDGRYLATANGGMAAHLTYVPNGKMVPALPAGPIIIRDGSTGKIIRKLLSPFNMLGAMEFSVDGKSLYLAEAEVAGPGGNPTHGSAGCWDVVTGKRLFAFDQNNSAWFRYAFSPDGRWLVTAAHADEAYPAQIQNSILIWNAHTGVREHTLTGQEKMLYAASFSRDGRLLATTDTSTVRIWDTTTWKLLRTLNLGEYEIDGVAFSPDGKQLVTSGQYISVWNIADLSPGKSGP